MPHIDQIQKITFSLPHPTTLLDIGLKANNIGTDTWTHGSREHNFANPSGHIRKFVK